ncbi:MAG TPA: NirA family protein [Terracidiphilus sp.]|nr:NirA family protein [Terracidiphilus sp.]
MEIAEAVNPAPFTTEQKQYLEGFFAGAMQRFPQPFVGLDATGKLTATSASAAENLAEEKIEHWHGTPVSDLCREELWKYEQNPLDIWDKLIAHADANQRPAADDLFRFKFHGLFYVAPAQDSFMLRLRIPGGSLQSHQLIGLAEVAEEWGSGRADITTRANLQIREFAPKDIVRVLMKVHSLGLTAKGSGADNIRNITATPTTGFDPTELIDVSPYADAMHHYILNSRDLYDLPRKFNIAFDSGGAISVVADTNDIGFVAVRVAEGKPVPAGVYFRVLLCGITGHKQFASDCGLLLKPEQAIAVAAAMIRVFAENGDRTDRKKARLKYLVDKWGVERFLEETEALLDFKPLRAAEDVNQPRPALNRAAHIGVYPQNRAGLNYIGLSIPVGRFPAAQMRAIAEVARQFGSGQIRLTVWQNLLIPDVLDANLDAAIAAIRACGLDCEAGTVLRGTISCTGNQGCRFAATNTKSHAVELANFIDKRFKIIEPVNLHVTGCPHSCAQHYVGDIGLLGTKVNGEEGYQVVLGGGSDTDKGLARELIPSIRFADLPPAMEKLFAGFGERRHDGESFLAFTRRHTIDELKQLLKCTER